MAEKMLVTQALDERDLLTKRIFDKISKALFVDVKKHNEETGISSRATAEIFRQETLSLYQQIMDLIDRYQRIDAAIIASNAATVIHTSYGDYTVAGAIALRNRLDESRYSSTEAYFETRLLSEMNRQLNDQLLAQEALNKKLESTAESMRLSILGKDTKTKDEKPLEVVSVYVRENTAELMDPLDVKKKIEELQEKKEKLVAELDTQIKVSNATTFIEIQ